MQPRISYFVCGTPLDYSGNLTFAERKLRNQADARSEEWVHRYHNVK